MFGYIQPDFHSLSKEQQARYRRCYCGVCTALNERYGSIGRLTLSYDMTFLALVLDALYVEEEDVVHERCPVHLARGVDSLRGEIMRYAADMNILLSYFKQLDNWQDDKNLLSKADAALLGRAFSAIKTRRPGQTEAIEIWIRQMREIERSGNNVGIDLPVNATGRMLGAIYSPHEDLWRDALAQIGDGIGRFVYFMDACDDLKRDIRGHSFNPLIDQLDRTDYWRFCRSALASMLADAAKAFEALPIIRNADLIRNTLYSGAWLRFNRLQRKEEKEATQLEQRSVSRAGRLSKRL